MLWDDDYQFESQEFAPLPEVAAVQSGDVLETSCTMCFTILMSD